MKGYKTLVFGAIVAGLGSIQAADIATVVPSGYEGFAMALIGAVVIGLRTATSTPVGKRASDQ